MSTGRLIVLRYEAPAWLRFAPQLKERVWGGDRLASWLGKSGVGIGLWGESWEMSEVEGSVSVVAHGPLRGWTMTRLRKERPEIFGLDGAPGTGFPLLVKFIDARESLSVQVHPDDRLEPGRGKTEAWVILHADPGSAMIKGFSRDLTRDEFVSNLHSGGLGGCLNRVPVKPGDVMFVPGRAVHAIGAGIVLMEIQQTSDTTYRLYDWDRVGLDGKPRQLHVDQALRVMDLGRNREDLASGVEFDIPNGRVHLALACPLFAIEVGEGKGPIRFPGDSDKFSILSLIGGHGTISGESGKEPVSRGDTLFVPAGGGELVLDLPRGGSWVRAYVPEKQRDIDSRLAAWGVRPERIARVWREIE